MENIKATSKKTTKNNKKQQKTTKKEKLNKITITNNKYISIIVIQ